MSNTQNEPAVLGPVERQVSRLDLFAQIAACKGEVKAWPHWMKWTATLPRLSCEWED